MEQPLLTLQAFLDVLGENQQFHICIHDMTGILEQEALRIKRENMYHSTHFCDCAKVTKKGMELCFGCKLLSIKKAVTGRKPYWGVCPLGVSELVYPVLLGQKVAAIIYIGHLVTVPREVLEHRLKRVSRLTGVPVKPLLRAAEGLCPAPSMEYYCRLAGVIQSYLLLLYKKNAPARPEAGHHWAVDAVKKYIEAYYNKSISIMTVSKLYYLNENYLGRLFKQKTGQTFAQYLNQVRIQQACRLLRAGGPSILEIAYQVGYNNVSYFNRTFKKEMGMTPAAFQRQSSG